MPQLAGAGVTRITSDMPAQCGVWLVHTAHTRRPCFGQCLRAVTGRSLVWEPPSLAHLAVLLTAMLSDWKSLYQRARWPVSNQPVHAAGALQPADMNVQRPHCSGNQAADKKNEASPGLSRMAPLLGPAAGMALEATATDKKIETSPGLSWLVPLLWLSSHPSHHHVATWRGVLQGASTCLCCSWDRTA